MAKKITDKVTWVGKIDWELVYFHGHELSTYKGSSYNSYLVQDQKTALIDTCWKPYDEEYVNHLKETIINRKNKKKEIMTSNLSHVMYLMYSIVSLLYIPIMIAGTLITVFLPV